MWGGILFGRDEGRCASSFWTNVHRLRLCTRTRFLRRGWRGLQGDGSAVCPKIWRYQRDIPDVSMLGDEVRLLAVRPVRVGLKAWAWSTFARWTGGDARRRDRAGSLCPDARPSLGLAGGALSYGLFGATSDPCGRVAVFGELHPRQRRVLDRLLEAGPGGFLGGLSNWNYCRVAKVAPATAARDLADLVTRGLLSRHGAGRATRYDVQWDLALQEDAEADGRGVSGRRDGDRGEA